ncbi:MAG: hypothetical protein HQL08_09555 [Nitrospirae bacterium]|nr:hypothetical protein [Nitrospirota bacterium]
MPTAAGGATEAGGFGNGLGWTCSPSSGQYGGYAYGSLASNPLGSNGVWWDPRNIIGSGGAQGTPGAPGSTCGESVPQTTGTPGGYGGGGGDGGIGGGGGWGNGAGGSGITIIYW